MRCYYHPDKEAVGICKNCHKGLCPDCAADVENGIACRDRCENRVRALNEALEKGKRAYGRTRTLYSRIALICLLMGVLILLVGLALLSEVGVILIPTGLIFVLASYFYYSVGRRIDTTGRPGDR